MALLLVMCYFGGAMEGDMYCDMKVTWEVMVFYHLVLFYYFSLSSSLPSISSLPAMAVYHRVLQGRMETWRSCALGQLRPAMVAPLHSRLMSLNLYSRAFVLCLIQSLLFLG